MTETEEMDGIIERPAIQKHKDYKLADNQFTALMNEEGMDQSESQSEVDNFASMNFMEEGEKRFWTKYQGVIMILKVDVGVQYQDRLRILSQIY